MTSICVFCGSSMGSNPEFKQLALSLGKYFAENDIMLIYGGGNVGLMGALSHSVMNHGGKVTGVIPNFMVEKELADYSITKLHRVDSMHERKKLMSDLADGFIAIPGGIGTLDELFEIFTWRQLGLHSKPIGLLNYNGYYDSMINFLRNITANGFMKQEILDYLIVKDKFEDLVSAMF
ncbi:MAG: TIGR00730 family Rossman fold protein [Ignavibacteria bacterium]|nr:TIGR00730 family Rossman fold protein [Ignavibacteria bacterium]